MIDKNLIQIYWENVICWETACSYDERRKFNPGPADKTKIKAWLSDKQEYYLNTKYSKVYKIESDKEKTIEVTFYPISPDYYAYDSYSVIENKHDLKELKDKWETSKITKSLEEKAKSPTITFFHNILDIYGLRIVDMSDIYSDPYGKSFSKSYKFVKMKEWNYMYIPYYTTKINLKKWENFFKLEYFKHTVEFQNWLETWDVYL